MFDAESERKGRKIKWRIMGRDGEKRRGRHKEKGRRVALVLIT